MDINGVIIDPKDKKYFVQKPDASFSPQRNYAVMKQVHEETTRFFQGLRSAQMQKAGERIDVLTSYADYKFNRGGGKGYEEYVGKSLRNRLIGERILEKVRILSSVDKLQGRRMVQL